MATLYRSYLPDALLSFDSFTSSGGGPDASNAIDLRDKGGVVGDVVCNVSACEVGTDELYVVSVQVSDDSTFATGVYETGRILLGHSSVTPHATTFGTGRYIIGAGTIWKDAGYRYMRLSVASTGSADSITLAGFFAPTTHPSGSAF